MTSILRDRRLRVQKPENSGARCCVVGCSNRRGLDKVNGVQRSFHAFPTDQKRRQMWVKAIPRKLWTPGQWDRVCGDHFVGGEQLQIILSYHYTGFFRGTRLAAFPPRFFYLPHQASYEGADPAHDITGLKD